MKKEATPKKWFLRCLIVILFALFCCFMLVIIIDPYFHYHKPLDGMTYRMREERYTNPGIAKNFEYETIVTGTSMTRNFMPSLIDELFQTTSVKLPIPGGRYGDINELLRVAFDANKDIKHVMVTMDLDRIIMNYNEKNDETVPYYLYDNNPFNDISYLLNKTVLVHDCLGNIMATVMKQEGSTLDSYASYDSECGKDAVLSQYYREENICDRKPYGVEEQRIVEDNINKNYISLIKEHPDTHFDIIIPPYSIVYWDSANRKGELENQIMAEQKAIEMLLQYENVSVYSFYNDTELICNLDNYYDSIHYNADISRKILTDISEQKSQITLDNLDKRMEEDLEFLTTYGYDTLFE